MSAADIHLDDAFKEQDIQTGKEALQTEIEGLKALEASINGDFSRAAAIIDAMKQARHGRLIVAGIGKSGHVARKLAATFASTGTPAYFVHPGEASHGDLGMITEDDVVLMLSNSGENSELSDLIFYTRRFGIPLIGMTSRPDSTLAKHSDICLLLPKAKEACPNGLAPTTSTTMMMALGDALAVTLLERMGLTKEQYKVFHPGGKLGQRLRKVSELMQAGSNLPCVEASTTMDQVLLVLTEKNLGAVLVTDQDRLLGLVTDGDLKRHMGPDLLTREVQNIMTKDPHVIASDSLAAEALEKMTTGFRQPITCLPVVDGGKLVGLIRMQDCLMAGLS